MTRPCLPPRALCRVPGAVASAALSSDQALASPRIVIVGAGPTGLGAG